MIFTLSKPEQQEQKGITSARLLLSFCSLGGPVMLLCKLVMLSQCTAFCMHPSWEEGRDGGSREIEALLAGDGRVSGCRVEDPSSD